MRSIPVPSTTRCALSNGMLRFATAQIMIFGIIDGIIKNVKIVICAMQNLTIPLDRAHRAVLEIGMEHLEEVLRQIGGEITRIGFRLHSRDESIFDKNIVFRSMGRAQDSYVLKNYFS